MIKTLVELFIVRKTKNSDERTCFFLLFYLAFSLLQLGEKPIFARRCPENNQFESVSK